MRREKKVERNERGREETRNSICMSRNRVRVIKS